MVELVIDSEVLDTVKKIEKVNVSTSLCQTGICEEIVQLNREEKHICVGRGITVCCSWPDSLWSERRDPESSPESHSRLLERRHFSATLGTERSGRTVRDSPLSACAETPPPPWTEDRRRRPTTVTRCIWWESARVVPRHRTRRSGGCTSPTLSDASRRGPSSAPTALAAVSPFHPSGEDIFISSKKEQRTRSQNTTARGQ